jgi:hypothetical protein
MFEMNFGGQTVEVYEHIKELKELDGDLNYIFGRFYNKKQLLKKYIGIYTFTENGKTITEDFTETESAYGLGCGGESVIGSRIGDYWVEFSKLEDIGRDEAEMKELLYQYEWGGAFLKADDGQIYFINWNVD